MEKYLRRVPPAYYIPRNGAASFRWCDKGAKRVILSRERLEITGMQQRRPPRKQGYIGSHTSMFARTLL